MSRNIVPASGVTDGASLLVRLRDTVKAVKVHRNRLSDLCRQCDSLLSTVREYSPLLVGTRAAADADAIERVVERILKRVSGWARLSDTAAFLKQNEIQAGIEECYRELTACNDRFMMALAMTNNVENQMKDLARQRDHRELVDMLASFLEEVRKYSRLMASEAPQIAEPLVQTEVLEVDGGQSVLPVGSASAPGPSRSELADISGKVSKASEQVIIEGSLLDFYPGEWTDDGERTTLGRLKDQSPTSQMRFKELIEASVGLRHRNILDFFGYITIYDTIYSVNPWMENGNIREYIRQNPGADRMRILGEVASGVEFLHERGIVHGDLCGKNILINSDGRAAVCGFGLTECSNPNLDLSRARWFAPEKITSASVALATEEGDSWSFGSLCLEVFTGEDPYSSRPDLYVPVLLSQGVAPEHPGSKAVGLTPNMWELMQSCWKIEPAERPSMSTIQSTIRGKRPLRDPRQGSSVSSDPSLRTPVSPASDSISPVEAGSKYIPNSPELPPVKTPPGNPPFGTREPSLLMPTAPTGIFDQQTGTEAQGAHSRKVSDPPSLVSGRLPPLLEVPVNFNIPSRRQSSGSLDQPFQSPRASDATASTSFRTTASSPTPPSTRTTAEDPPLTNRTWAPSPSMSTPPTGILDQHTGTEAQGSHFRRVSDPPPSSSVSGRLPPLLEVPVNFNIPAPLSAPPSHFPSPGKRNQSRPSTAPNPITPSVPFPATPIPSDLQRQFSVDSSSSQSTSSTGESVPRRRWPFMTPKRSRTTPNSTPDSASPVVHGDLLPSLPPSIPSSDTLSVHQKAPSQARPSVPNRAQTTPLKATKNSVASHVSRSGSLLVPLPQSRKWEPLSPAVLEFLEKVASDSDGLLRPAADGSVSAGNLEGLVSRIITGSADKSKDDHFIATFLTVYQLFATSERLFEVLKRRFGSTELESAHVRSRFNILLFIEKWLKKGFEDEELKCSARIKEFALAIRGSGTMEEKAQEIVSLIDNPDYVRLRQPGNHAHLRREPAERPQHPTPTDLAAALTVVEGDRFKAITYWDYVNSTRGRSNMRRIVVFNTVHDLITVWVKRTVLRSDELGERMKKYEEWIHTAQACWHMNNFSSAAAIVIALTSPAITSLPLTCESKARPILHAFARDLAPADGAYQNVLQQAMTKDLIPWLDPLLSSLNSTFAHCDPIVEVDEHPLIDFRQCIRLAEQIDSLVRYSPPRVRTPPDVVAYVEYSLKSCVGDDQTLARSAKLMTEEQSLVDRRERMRSLGMPWSPHPLTRRK